MDDYTEKILCPGCNSSLIEFNQKGFGVGKAALGYVATGGIGLLAGFIGSRKIKATCLSCGKTFAPQDGYVKEYFRESIQSEPVSATSSNSVESDKMYSTIVNLSDEDVVKKFKMWDNLHNKGLISESELSERKREYLSIRGKRSK